MVKSLQWCDYNRTETEIWRMTESKKVTYEKVVFGNQVGQIDRYEAFRLVVLSSLHFY